ncbi:MAG: HrpJ domain-containing protein [Rhabdochlamydiaceae bacterium]
MSQNSISGPHSVPSSQISIRSDEDVQEAIMEQEESDFAMLGTRDTSFNPLSYGKNQTLENRKSKKTEEMEEEVEKLEVIENIEETAEKFEQRNPELQKALLLILKNKLKDSDTPEDILRKSLETFGDISLVDDALDFLEQTCSKELKKTIQETKTEINHKYDFEIKSGKNILEPIKEFSSLGIGSPKALREFYRDVLTNPREPANFFYELQEKFTYQKMEKVIHFLLHSLGADLKSKGPSLMPGELYRLLNETRDLQAILGIYSFFKSHMMNLIRDFKKQETPIPSNMNFNSLTQQLIQIIKEPQPNPDRLIDMCHQFGLKDNPYAQIVLLSLFRNAITYQTAVRLFRSDSHRQVISFQLGVALEKIYQTIENLQEIEEKNQKPGYKKDLLS